LAIDVLFIDLTHPEMVRISYWRVLMKNILKVAVAGAVLTLGTALPAMAQIDEGSIEFTTSFPFYAGNARMPAGSYKITQPDMNLHDVLIQNTAGNSAFVEFIPTISEQPRENSAVTFQKYDGVDYLNRVWVDGGIYGMKVDPSKSELKAASAAADVENSTAGN
jgi:hypothetical protein